MRKTLILMIALFFSVTGAHASSDLIKQTKVEMKKAKEAGFLWRDTAKILKKGKKAVEEGNKKKGVKLIEQALEQAKDAQQQAKDQAKAGPRWESQATDQAGAGSSQGAPQAEAGSSQEASPEMISEGKKISFNRKKGNCLACHAIAGGNLPGNIAPPLVAMKTRYPDKGKLRAQIWDSTKLNKHTMMPPFGRHNILTEEEIDKVVAYIYTL